MPLIDWLEETHRDPACTHLLIEDTPNQSVGPFLNLIEVLTGITADLLLTRRFRRAQGSSLELHGYLSGPYKPESFTNIQSAVGDRFDLTASEDQPEILLIERGRSSHGFESDWRLGARARTTGVDRRSIVNHAEIAQALQCKYGKKFRNVLLEDMPMAEQVQLFYRARIIIGQHGAGLNNLIWMHSDKGMVIEISPVRTKTFQNMCSARGFTYRTFGSFEEDQISVDANELLSTINDLTCEESIH